MNHFLHGVVRASCEAFDLPGPVLEIGSYQVPGQEALADLRPLFADKPYLGIDVRAGPGVDRLADVENLPWADASVGTVLALNTFEHVARFWRGFEEIRRVLCADGALLVSCPFYFPIHNYPRDYWRITPAGLEVLLADYPTTILGWHGPKNRPLHVWGLAFRENYPPPTQRQLEGYRALLHRYAREPKSWWKWGKYQLGQLFFGRGPFAAFLDQNCWEIVCRTHPLSNRCRPRRELSSGVRQS